MGQYCFARWRLLSVGIVCRRRLSGCVTLPPGAWVVGAPAAGRVGGRVADTARRASTVASH